MSRVFWDTNLFIYLFEDYGELSERVANLRERMLARNDQLYTSTLTLGELLVRPLEAGDAERAWRYEQVLASTAVLIPFEAAAARTYASLRRDRKIRAPDGIQLACAAQARADLFITNDDRLCDKTIPGIQFIVSLEKAFL